MRNPYLELHREFRAAGAEMLVSSGQACVLYGIAAFSRDGDWVIREDAASCNAALGVLARRDAQYRLGAPLDVAWLHHGWTASLWARARRFTERFPQLRQRWRADGSPLKAQHEDLLREATSLIEEA
jgi:hypothetical protein